MTITKETVLEALEKSVPEYFDSVEQANAVLDNFDGDDLGNIEMMVNDGILLPFSFTIWQMSESFIWHASVQKGKYTIVFDQDSDSLPFKTIDGLAEWLSAKSDEATELLDTVNL